MLRTDTPPRRDLYLLIKRFIEELGKWLEIYEESRHRLAELGTEINWFDKDVADRLGDAMTRLDEAMDAIKAAINDLDIDLVLARSASRVN
ncbi:MAG: hypothetical protein GXO43_09880 [Crenarchaeota archaeon]|nr:hypothetical protein [Thermoproteota archaeon]